jgi:O-antigen ligase
MASYVASRNFALAALIWVVAGALLISLLPQFGGWLIALSFLPFALRPLAGRLPFPRTSFDLFLCLFLLTAALGVWAAYDPASAWTKFWTLASAVLVLYALALQPHENLNRVTLGLCALGAWVTVHFLLAFDFNVQPSDFGLLRRVGEAWLAVRPELGLAPVNTNVFGGVLAMLLPFHLATALRAWRTGSRFELGWAVVTGTVSACGLLLTSSRAAWLALAAGLALWGLWAACVWLAPRLHRGAERLFGGAMALIGAALIVIVLVYPGGLLGLANRLPGLQSGYSRVALWAEAASLTSDYPLTGGGLDSFAGHYARYELVIPYKLFEYAHNLPLDVLFEQGVFGALALVAIVLGSLWRLFTAEAGNLRGAMLAAWAAVLLHSLVDDALYSGAGTPWLFVLPGLGLWLAPQPASQRRWLLVQTAALALAGLAVAVIPTWRAAALANAGAVEMARLELRGWPERNWQDEQDVGQLIPARALLEQALSLDPQNRTARYRLGLIWLRQDDVEKAVGYFQMPRLPSDIPRGMAKNLGYSYTWLGRIDDGVELVRTIPEAQYEMELYAQWWPTVGRPDRGEHAAQMARRLAELGLPYTSNPLERLP